MKPKILGLTVLAAAAAAAPAQAATLYDQTVTTPNGTHRFFADEDDTSGVRSYGITGDGVPDGFLTVFPNEWVRKAAELFARPTDPAVRVVVARVTGNKPQNLRLARDGRRVVLAGRDVAGRYRLDFHTGEDGRAFEAFFRTVVFPSPAILPHLLRDFSPANCCGVSCAPVSCANGQLEIASGQCCPTCVTGTTPTVFPPPVQAATFKSRPCPNSSIYVDVPLFQTTPWPNLDWVPQATATFEAAAKATNFDWFCTDANGCQFPDGIEVRLERVLDERPDTAGTFREDGHLRFLRFRFRNAATGDELELAEGGECLAIEAARNAVFGAANLGGGVSDEPPVYVGRECEASAQFVEADPSQEMLNWHLTRMGLPESATEVGPPQEPEGLVDFALIDSGVDPVVATALGILSEEEFSAGGARDPHGSIMAILARQIAPEAAIRSYRVLGENGAGVSDALARGIDAAIFGRTDRLKPLIINLSLGFSGQLGRSGASANGACTTREDPYGEVIRYLLQVADFMDLAATETNPITGRISVVGAAGNQPLQAEEELFPDSELEDGLSVCDADSGGFPLGQSQFFLPAQWYRDVSCVVPENQARKLILAVSAINSRNQPAALTTTQFNSSVPNQSEIVAYGEHVMVDLEGTAPTLDTCSTGSLYPPPLTLPAALTGSSVSAVLTSATMARIQEGLIARSRSPFSRAALAAYVYITGRSNCGPRTIDGNLVREVDAGRADAGLACTGFADCVELATQNAPRERVLPTLSEDLIERCRTELSACALETFDAAGDLVVSCRVGDQILPPASYTPPACTTTFALQSPPTIINGDVCAAAGNCPTQTGIDRGLLGSSGPLPDGTGCNWCYAAFDSSTNTLEGFFGLNADFPPGTQFLNPFLEIAALNPSTGFFEVRYINLTSVSDTDAWTPGNSIQIQTTLAGQLGLDLSSAQSRLIMDIDSPEGGGLQGKQVDPIPWDFR